MDKLYNSLTPQPNVSSSLTKRIGNYYAFVSLFSGMVFGTSYFFNEYVLMNHTGTRLVYLMGVGPLIAFILYHGYWMIETYKQHGKFFSKE